MAVHHSAQFTKLSLTAGTYRLVVRGGAEGTPQNGFSNYSSLGWYAMKGTLAGAIVNGYPAAWRRPGTAPPPAAGNTSRLMYQPARPA